MESPDTSERAFDALSLTECLRECLVCGVMALDAGGRICVFNGEAERLTGLKAATVLGSGPDALPEALREPLEKAVRGTEVSPEIELTLPAGGTGSIRVRCSITRSLAGNGAYAGVLLVMNDVTAANALVANLQRFDRLASIGTLSAGMAHEIKNAFVAVTTFVQDLIRRNQDSELAGLVNRELRRIDSILTQMLRFAGPARPTFLELSLHRLLDHSLRLVHPQLEAKRIRLSRNFNARSDRVKGDLYQLEQAFLNIFLNAIAAMEDHGHLIVSTETGDGAGPGQLRATISDTGPGIPPGNLERLFEPFFSTKPQGTGLGLAITRRIVLEHQGKIGVESEPGKGTSFRIALPLAHANG